MFNLYNLGMPIIDYILFSSLHTKRKYENLKDPKESENPVSFKVVCRYGYFMMYLFVVQDASNERKDRKTEDQAEKSQPKLVLIFIPR